MGWLKLGSRQAIASEEARKEYSFAGDPKATKQHIECTSVEPNNTPRMYDFVPLSLPDSQLPFISPGEISKHKSAMAGSLLVDDIVYDCAKFISEHPGGEQIIQSFAGSECSWQFWRFHGKGEMENFGKVLRVGRTMGLKKKFAEPKKYVGLRRLGDDWDEMF